jgi:hypothetical protein
LLLTRHLNRGKPRLVLLSVGLLPSLLPILLPLTASLGTVLANRLPVFIDQRVPGLGVCRAFAFAPLTSFAPFASLLGSSGERIERKIIDRDFAGTQCWPFQHRIVSHRGQFIFPHNCGHVAFHGTEIIGQVLMYVGDIKSLVIRIVAGYVDTRIFFLEY